MVFGIFKKKKYPKLSLEMFQPQNKPIKIATGKKLVKDFLLQIDYCDKEEAKEYAEEFENHIKLEIDELKSNLNFSKVSIKEDKEYLKDQKLKLKSESDEDEIEHLESEIEDTELRLKEINEEMEQEKNNIDNLKSDNRNAIKNYLIDYVNCVVHGENWKELD